MVVIVEILRNDILYFIVWRIGLLIID
jgi:hypothetical protein